MDRTPIFLARMPLRKLRLRMELHPKLAKLRIKGNERRLNLPDNSFKELTLELNKAGNNYGHFIR